MRTPRFQRLMDKAQAAMVSAIEAYNKPDFKYREETFALLATNAWELMLKAKLLRENGNKVACLRVYEKRRRADGRLGTRQYLKRNRSGNPQTISLRQTIGRLESRHSLDLDQAIKANLDALIEIRDNAAHYLNVSSDLAKVVLEVGAASVANFVRLGQRWFGRTFESYRLFLMPLSFVQPPANVTGLATSGPEAKLLAYLKRLVAETPASAGSDFHVAIEVNVSMTRSAAASTTAVRITSDPNAPAVQLSEEDIRQRWPWDYRELTRRLRSRYTDFLENAKYHRIRKAITDDRYVRTRYLDPGNPRTTKKSFFSPNVLHVFDQHYMRRDAAQQADAPGGASRRT